MSDVLRAFFSRLRAIFSNTQMEDDFKEELAAHVDLLTSENEKGGMTPDEARRAALVRIGGLELTREIHRETRGLPFLEVFWQDCRYAVRTLRRDAGFFLAAVCIVGLGIGASATIFSVVNALLLRPLPFQDPGRLVWIANDDGGTGGLSAQTVQVDPFLEMRSQNHSFSDMAAYFAFYGVGDSKLTGSGEPERLTTVPVSQNFFSLLGVQPQLGRLFNDDECKWNGPKVVLLSDGLWKRRFGSVGRGARVNS
jgi:MacB-like periplasmic core domain